MSCFVPSVVGDQHVPRPEAILVTDAESRNEAGAGMATIDIEMQRRQAIVLPGEVFDREQSRPETRAIRAGAERPGGHRVFDALDRQHVGEIQEGALVVFYGYAVRAQHPPDGCSADRPARRQVLSREARDRRLAQRTREPSRHGRISRGSDLRNWCGGARTNLDVVLAGTVGGVGPASAVGMCHGAIPPLRKDRFGGDAWERPDAAWKGAAASGWRAATGCRNREPAKGK